MSDLPFGIARSTLQASEIKTADPSKLQSARTVKKTPFQKHKEEQERKKKLQDEEAKAMLDSFVASFAEKKGPAFVSSAGNEYLGNATEEKLPLSGLAAIKKKFETRSGPTPTSIKHETPTPSEHVPSKSSQSSRDARDAKALFSMDDDEKARNIAEEERNQSIRKKAQKRKEIDSFMEELKKDQEMRDRTKPPQFDESRGRLSDSDERMERMSYKSIPQEEKSRGLDRSADRERPPLDRERDREARDRPPADRERDRGDRGDRDRDRDSRDRDRDRDSRDRDRGERKPIPGDRERNPYQPNPNQSIHAISAMHAGIQGAPQIQVMAPDERLRAIIDMFADVVIVEGIPLEQLVIQKQQTNPHFSFLYELGSPANVYYKWRVYSLLNGDSLISWRIAPFQMFMGGPFWLPPPLPRGSKERDTRDRPRDEYPRENHRERHRDRDDFPRDERDGPRHRDRDRDRDRDEFPRERERERSSHEERKERSNAMNVDEKERDENNNEYPEGDQSEVVEPLVIPDLSTKFKGKPLMEDERDEFEDILRNLSIERSKIKNAMGFALDHAESAPEIVETISESLTILKTPVLLKIARLYLISDILHNVRSVANGSLFRIAFEETLHLIFISLRHKYQTITSRMTQQTFKEPILKILRVWSEWCVFSQDLLRSYYDTFLDTTRPPPKVQLSSKPHRPSSFDDEIDGVPMTDAEYEALMNESSSEEEEEDRRKNDDVEMEQSFSLAQYGDIS
jgi:U2-associated protein SR140